MIGMSVYDTTLGTTIGNLGMTDVEFPKPVFHGDTLKAHTKIDLEAAEPNHGRRRDRRVRAHRDRTSAARSSRAAAAPRLMHCKPKGLTRCARCCSCLATASRKFESARKTAADRLILDLEDSVVADQKVGAREIVRGMLKQNDGRQKLYVRVNALDTGLTLGDLAAVVPAEP